LRWKIEVFHKILKSGCKAEESKLLTAQRLTNLISVYCILRWRVFWMTMLNRSERADPPAGLGGQRQGVRGVDVKGLAPHTRPADRFANARLLSAGQSVEFVEPGIAVMASWAFSFSTRRSRAWNSASLAASAAACSTMIARRRSGSVGRRSATKTMTPSAVARLGHQGRLLNSGRCHATRSGGAVRRGRRQSMPSSGIDSCADVSRTVPSAGDG
jgi:hypothetical protein